VQSSLDVDDDDDDDGIGKHLGLGAASAFTDASFASVNMCVGPHPVACLPWLRVHV
jgi:hypothetical protein